MFYMCELKIHFSYSIMILYMQTGSAGVLNIVRTVIQVHHVQYKKVVYKKKGEERGICIFLFFFCSKQAQMPKK